MSKPPPPPTLRFDGFVLNPGDRQLWRGGERVELSGRYFDALALLVRERGTLVSKDRFMAEVWHGTPVTDEALTQCIRTLRRALGDSAERPRYIQTVPKHGYRFVAEAEEVPAEIPAGGPADRPGGGAPAPAGWTAVLALGGAGALGGAAAGVAGGLLYGLGADAGGMGAASVLLVMLVLNVAAGLAGGAGVGLGIALGALRGTGLLAVPGGALGGLAVGGAARLLGLDVFNLLFGRAPEGFTGGAEGAVLGGMVALGAWLGGGLGPGPAWRPVAAAGTAGALAGVLVTALGGRLMGGSLDLLARAFADSRLDLAAFGRLVGEDRFGPVAQTVLAGTEGMLFGSLLAAAIVLAGRRMGLRSA